MRAAQKNSAHRTMTRFASGHVTLTLRPLKMYQSRTSGGRHKTTGSQNALPSFASRVGKTDFRGTVIWTIGTEAVNSPTARTLSRESSFGASRRCVDIIFFVSRWHGSA